METVRISKTLATWPNATQRHQPKTGSALALNHYENLKSIFTIMEVNRNCEHMEAPMGVYDHSFES
jgi:hypothetical protein